jgi:hypothetical protein
MHDFQPYNMKHQMFSLLLLVCSVSATFFDREITTGDGKTYRIASTLGTAEEVESKLGCDVTCGEYCFVFSTGKHAREYNALTPEEVKECVGFCGCSALVQDLTPKSASTQAPPKPKPQPNPTEPSEPTPAAQCT